MKPTLLFCDTEWADVLGAELVSLALVSVDGEHRFYAERDPLPAHPTDFVRLAVFPLLDRGGAALSDAAFTTNLRRFLSRIDAPCVLFDCHTDGALLQYALAGFDLPDPDARSCGPIPSLKTEVLRDSLITKFLEAWFQHHPDAAVRRHHSAVDAEALRRAWLAANGIEVPWSSALIKSPDI